MFSSIVSGLPVEAQCEHGTDLRADSLSRYAIWRGSLLVICARPALRTISSPPLGLTVDILKNVLTLGNFLSSPSTRKRAFLRRPQRLYKRKMRSHSASYPSPLAHQIEGRPCFSQTSAAAL
ncbi:hypothetical protein RRG08_021977 [Elysia crispata]|uniref:Uncharacterized protein n=1 Tax=Elysia crispata TaxID=231223 RepID=A0AAE1B3S8_9GAST|nr:hypothetical protein RRG08_021977 [Elysia crispata]